MKKYRHFTTQELQYIRENYGRLNHYAVAENLGRSPSSVLYHIQKMGLVSIRDKYKDPIPDTMPMSEADIVLEFDQAANKPLQIRILADLNCVTQKKIKSILKNNGREIPKTRAKQTISK